MVGETASSSSPDRRLVSVSARKSVRVRPAQPKAFEDIGWRLYQTRSKGGKGKDGGTKRSRRIVSPPPVE
jgi:hypothetical protein